MTVGRRYATEWHNDRDPITDRQVWRLTTSSAEDYAATRIHHSRPMVVR